MSEWAACALIYIHVYGQPSNPPARAVDDALHHEPVAGLEEVQAQSGSREHWNVVKKDRQAQPHGLPLLPRLLQPLLVEAREALARQPRQRERFRVVLRADDAHGAAGGALVLPLQRPHQAEPAHGVPARRRHGFAQQPQAHGAFQVRQLHRRFYLRIRCCCRCRSCRCCRGGVRQGGGGLLHGGRRLLRLLLLFMLWPVRRWALGARGDHVDGGSG